MDQEIAELMAERHRLVGYDLPRAVAAVDAELERRGYAPDGSKLEAPKQVAPVDRQAPRKARA